MSSTSGEKILFFGCAGLSILCQIAGFAGMEKLELSAAAVGLAALWLLASRFSARVLGSTTLVVTAALAVTGMILGGSGWRMICSAAFGLAAWDLLLLEAAIKDTPDDADRRAYRDNHLRTCGAAVGGGLTLALVGRLITLQIPFMVMVVLVVLAVFGFGRVWRFFAKSSVKSRKV